MEHRFVVECNDVLLRIEEEPQRNTQLLAEYGAGDGSRTRDLLLGKETLYH